MDFEPGEAEARLTNSEAMVASASIGTVDLITNSSDLYFESADPSAPRFSAVNVRRGMRRHKILILMAILLQLD